MKVNGLRWMHSLFRSTGRVWAQQILMYLSGEGKGMVCLAQNAKIAEKKNAENKNTKKKKVHEKEECEEECIEEE